MVFSFLNFSAFSAIPLFSQGSNLPRLFWGAFTPKTVCFKRLVGEEYHESMLYIFKFKKKILLFYLFFSTFPWLSYSIVPIMSILASSLNAIVVLLIVSVLFVGAPLGF